VAQIWIGADTQALGLQAESAAYARFGAELDNLRAAVAHALATGQRQNACEIVALVHNFAYQRPAWEVFDWVRPVHLHEQASPAEMICGLRGEFIDWQRGTPGSGSPLRSRADLPAWYASASLPLAMMYLQNQIFTGGDLGVVADLVEAARPQGEREQLRVGQIKLFIAYARQWNGYLTVAELEQVRALGSRSVALARRLGDARQLAMTLVPFAAAIRVENPEEAIPLAKEAADIASRLGAGFALEQANRIVIPAMARVQGSPEHLSLLRAAIATAAEQQKLISASQWAMLSLPLYAHNDPDAALRLFAVIKRTIGMDRRRDLEAGGLAVPEDLAPLMQRTAHLSLGEAIQDILAACDQAIATASRAKGAS
jgi:hypothetical protein